MYCKFLMYQLLDLTGREDSVGPNTKIAPRIVQQAVAPTRMWKGDSALLLYLSGTEY